MRSPAAFSESAPLEAVLLAQFKRCSAAVPCAERIARSFLCKDLATHQVVLAPHTELTVPVQAYPDSRRRYHVCSVAVAKRPSVTPLPPLEVAGHVCP